MKTVDLDGVQTAFAAQYGVPATRVIQAPGRVNLIGEHTDYNDGFVLPCAIDRATWIAARPRPDGVIRATAADFGNQTVTFEAQHPVPNDESAPWSAYVRGVVDVLLARGEPIAGVDLLIAGDVPRGSGLSSSASLEVAVGTTLSALNGLALSGVEIARIGQTAENDYVGCKCGIMDQLVSALGQADHALLVDCRSLETRAVSMPDGVAVVVVDSRVSRGLVDSAYNERRTQCEAAAAAVGVASLRDATMEMLDAQLGTIDPIVHRRARHVLTENARTLAAADALAAGDLTSMGRLMAASHVSLRDDFEVSAPQLDVLVEIIGSALGTVGGVRMTGAGFGGCVVALAPTDRVGRIEQAVAEHYEARTGLRAAIYPSVPSAGARVVI